MRGDEIDGEVSSEGKNQSQRRCAEASLRLYGLILCGGEVQSNHKQRLRNQQPAAKQEKSFDIPADDCPVASGIADLMKHSHGTGEEISRRRDEMLVTADQNKRGHDGDEKRCGTAGAS